MAEGAGEPLRDWPRARAAGTLRSIQFPPPGPASGTRRADPEALTPGPAAPGAPSASRSPESEATGAILMTNILVVDDSATMRRMVVAALRGLGPVRFDEAQSGLEAIERLSVGPVDLVLLDLNMPDVHGLEVLRFVRSHQAFQRIPVVVLTTRGDEESREAALREGATLYLTKPFAPEELAPRVRELLPRG